MIFIGISLYRNKKNFQYPPVAANCPDYWLDYPYDVTTKKPKDNYIAGSQCVGTEDIEHNGMNLGNGNYPLTANTTITGLKITDPVNLSGTITGANGTTYTFTGSNGACNKRNWADFNGISWDGITYGVNNPCYATETTTIESS